MSTAKRTGFKLPHNGPYVAVVTNNLDPTYMGGLEAVLQKGIVPFPDIKETTVTLQYLSPFSGATSANFQGNDPTNFDDVQKSYGMWMVPPDIGTKILCIFVEGDSNQGYWIGCVQDRWQNHMVPGIAASTEVAWRAGQQEKYDVNYVPVAEFLNKKNSDQSEVNLAKFHTAPKPVHPFADKLLKQGLLEDKIRGVTSSGARREVPSQTFGISTPGPLEVQGRKFQIGYKNAKYDLPITRSGGHTFVMDDGDLTGNNKLIRIRSISGHQILLHDTNNLIYIANADGTAWIEMTAQGKIDIYAKDSVSIHSEQDFNFRADRDVNIEAVRNVNIKAGKDMKKQADGKMSTKANGKSKGDDSEKSGRVLIDGDLEQFIKGDYKLTANKIDIMSLTTLHMASNSGTHNISYNGDINNSAKGKIFNGGGNPKPPDPAADAAKKTKDLETFELPYVNEGAEWKGKRYQDGTITSIMQRVPMREPWTQHESTDPTKYTSDSTDRENTTPPSSKSRGITPDQGQDAGANTSAPAANPTPPPPNPNTPPDWTKDTGFLNKVKALAAKLGADHLDLLTIMYVESRMSPSVKNPIGSATGLIQFIESTAKGLGTSTTALRQMTREEQMVYVEKYFDQFSGKLRGRANLDNLYLAIFRPASIGASFDTVLYREGTREYRDNKVLDKNTRDGGITVRDATAHLPRAKSIITRLLGG